MMIKAGHELFEKFLREAIDAIPPPYDSRLQNVAFILDDNPTPEQRLQLNLHPTQTLFGLYEGVPLPSRNGTLKLLPDKITIFKEPLMAASQNETDLRDKIGRTLWHEVAHYYGLDHNRIKALERKAYNNLRG